MRNCGTKSTTSGIGLVDSKAIAELRGVVVQKLLNKKVLADQKSLTSLKQEEKAGFQLQINQK
jgi:hypothetical protein